MSVLLAIGILLINIHILSMNDAIHKTNTKIDLLREKNEDLRLNLLSKQSYATLIAMTDPLGMHPCRYQILVRKQ